MDNQLRQIIEEAWNDRALLAESRVREAVRAVIEELDKGRLRTAEPIDPSRSQWQVNEWVKKAILLYFPMQEMRTMRAGELEWHDKMDLKHGYEELGVRVVPHAVARYGAYISPGAILMPSYVNIGAWVGAENAVTQNYLDQIPFREAMRARLTELWAYPWEGAPAKFGDYYYFYRNDGRQNQAVLYRQASLDAEPEVFLDPNTLSEDGTVALSGISFSEDGRYLAYAASASGSDWSDIHVIRTADKQPTGDIVKWVKLSNAVWTPDEKGFYYSTFDVPEAGVYSSQNQYQKVYYHTLGKPQSSDRLIHMDTQHPLRYFASSVSKDGKWLFITASEGTSGSEILYRKSSDKKFKVLLPGFANDHEIIRAENDKLYVRTNLDAPNYRVIRIDLNNPSVIEEIIPENPKNMLEIVSKPGDYMMASYLEDAQSQVYQYDWNGKLIRKVELPAIGSAGGFSGKKGETEAFYSLTNFTTPSTVYRYDLATGESTLYKRPEVKFSPEDYTTEQVFYTSKDGTKVPMFIVYRNGLKLDGNNPCYLYAYGGFQVSLAPWFNPAAIMFMEQGGVYCVANLRGGLEYGEEWHRGGMLDKKQNVFDDFIAAAEYLIANKYTSSKKLAIAGGSNGGLLVGACEVQRPDLFGVCLPAVGVMDMLRYHKFTIGWGWVVEYGSSDDEEQFGYLYKYSPLHNIKKGTKYPATLITTADHDDRVVPAHSFKFAAEMQYAQGGDAPILIRIDTKAGHGAGKPVSKRIEEATDVFSFLFENTDTPYKTVETK